jgi:hypothetical protein
VERPAQQRREGILLFLNFLLDLKIRVGMGLPIMKTGNGNALRGSATSNDVAERIPHRSRSFNIANLPTSIRDELNYRISDGEEGIELVEWLNSKPEVAEVVNKLFDGTPISEQNLSEWRKRGYQKWLAHRNSVDESNALSDNSVDLAATGIDCDKLLLTLTAAYAAMIQNWIITPGEQMTYKLAVYKNLTNGVIALRRAEIQKVRLEIECERLELLREKRLGKPAVSSTPSTETASSPNSATAPHESGSESPPRPATADGATPAASSSLPASEDSMRATNPAGAEERREPPCVSLAEDLQVDSASGGASFRSSDGDLRVPSSAAAPARENAPLIPKRDETPELDPAIPAPPPAIDFEVWRRYRLPSFAGVPRGGPSCQKPDHAGAASKRAASPEPRPAPQPKPTTPPAVNPGATRSTPIPTRPFAPAHARPRNPNKTIISIRPAPPYVKHDTTIRLARQPAPAQPNQ